MFDERPGDASCPGVIALERSASLTEHLSNVTDPRTGKITYPLTNILFMTICAVIAGADDFVAIAHFVNTKKNWFAKFLDMSSGVPSHDRFNSILKHIKPDEFERCLFAWLTKLHEITDGQVIAIDGKTLRRSYDHKDGKAALRGIPVVPFFCGGTSTCPYRMTSLHSESTPNRLAQWDKNHDNRREHVNTSDHR